MKKNKLFYISIFFISLLMLFFSFLNAKKKNEAIKKINTTLFYYKRATELDKYSILDGGINKLDSQFITYIDRNSGTPKTSLLVETLVRRPILILRLSDTYCDECTSSILNILDTVRSILPNFQNNCVILASYNSLRELTALLTSRNIPNQVFQIDSQHSILKSDEVGQPYLFVLLPDGNVTSLFIPLKEIPDLTKNYLTTVYRRYF